MRTTISIQDALLERAKEQALKEKCTVGDIVNDALRYRLIECADVDALEEPRPLKTYGRDGLKAGVDLADNASLLEKMEGND